jgi:hypothetical protein
MPVKKKKKSTIVARKNTSSFETEDHSAFLIILAGGLVVILCLYFLGAFNMMHFSSPQYKPLEQVMQRPATASGMMQQVSPSTPQNGY